MPKIASKCCELVKLCDINCSGSVFFETLISKHELTAGRCTCVVYLAAGVLELLSTYYLAAR